MNFISKNRKTIITIIIISLCFIINNSNINIYSNSNYTIISNPSNTIDEIYDMAIDNDFIYLAGSDDCNKNL